MTTWFPIINWFKLSQGMGQNTCIPHDMTIYWLSESHFLRSLLHNRSSTAGRRNATCPCQKRRLQGATEKPKPRCTWDHWDHGKCGWFMLKFWIKWICWNMLKYWNIFQWCFTAHVDKPRGFSSLFTCKRRNQCHCLNQNPKQILLLQQDCIRWICIQVAKWLMHYLSDIHFENHPKNNCCSSWHTSP